MKDFLTSESPLQGDEEIVAKVVPILPIDENESMFPNGKKYFCHPCKQGTHNQFEEDKVCKKNGCKCYCQGFYLGRNKKTLIKWGEADTSIIEDVDESSRTSNPKYDKIYQKLNLEYSKLKDMGIIFANKICTRCGIKGRFQGWVCKSCKAELSEVNQLKNMDLIL